MNQVMFAANKVYLHWNFELLEAISENDVFMLFRKIRNWPFHQVKFLNGAGSDFNQFGICRPKQTIADANIGEVAFMPIQAFCRKLQSHGNMIFTILQKTELWFSRKYTLRNIRVFDWKIDYTESGIFYFEEIVKKISTKN